MALDQSQLRMQYLAALERLEDLADRRTFLGNFNDLELQNAFAIPSINTNYLDAGNGNRNQQILQQVAWGL